jgi:hypothetical protein
MSTVMRDGIEEGTETPVRLSSTPWRARYLRCGLPEEADAKAPIYQVPGISLTR